MIAESDNIYAENLRWERAFLTVNKRNEYRFPLNDKSRDCRRKHIAKLSKYLQRTNAYKR
jgi:hypothetical protein